MDCEITKPCKENTSPQENLDLFRSLLDVIPQSVLLKDREGRILYVNKAHLKSLNMTLEECIGKTDYDFYPADMAEKYISDDKRVMETGEIFQDIEEHWMEDAQKNIYVYVIKTPVRNNDNEITGVQLVFWDISGLLEAEKEIERKNKELALINQIILSSTSGMDKNKLLRSTCHNMLDVFGLEHAVAALFDDQNNISDLVEETGSPSVISIKDFFTARKSIIESFIKINKPLLIENQNTGLKEDKDSFLSDHKITRILLVPSKIDDRLMGLLALTKGDHQHFTSNDINLLERVADQLAGGLALSKLTQNQKRLSAAIEQVADNIIIVDMNNKITYINPAFEKNTGYSPDEAIGKTARELFRNRMEESVYSDIVKTTGMRKPWHGRINNIKKDGKPYTADVTITPIKDKDNGISNYVIVERDVTRETELEQQFQQAQKMDAIGRLAGGIAHDFNNLLTAILGYTELSMFHLEKDSPAYEKLQGIIQVTNRAADLTRQLLTFARKQITKPVIINLNDLIANIVKMFKPLISENIDLKILPENHLGKVKADPVQMEQVVFNLILNARDAMPEGGVILIETGNVEFTSPHIDQYIMIPEGNYVMIGVKDTGRGINKKDIQKIFEPFFTTKESRKGTGLGLATCFGIVQQNKGYIKVESKPGVGSIFQVYLPVAEEGRIPEQRNETKIKPVMGKETVFLVEDENTVRATTASILKNQGYSVIEAENGLDAVRLIEDNPALKFHMLLTDMIMPKMGGKDLAEKILKKYPDTKVLFISGYSDDLFDQNLYDQNNISFLQKPFMPDDLLREIQRLFNSK